TRDEKADEFVDPNGDDPASQGGSGSVKRTLAISLVLVCSTLVVGVIILANLARRHQTDTQVKAKPSRPATGSKAVIKEEVEEGDEVRPRQTGSGDPALVGFVATVTLMWIIALVVAALYFVAVVLMLAWV